MSFPDIVLLGFNVILSCSIAHLILFFSSDIAARIEASSLFLCFLLDSNDDANDIEKRSTHFSVQFFT